VEWEQACSGKALPQIWKFVQQKRGLSAERPPDTREIFRAARKDPPDPVSGEVLELLAENLAAEAGNLALRFLATGGIYLGGGLAPRLYRYCRIRSCFPGVSWPSGRCNNYCAIFPSRSSSAGMLPSWVPPPRDFGSSDLLKI